MISSRHQILLISFAESTERLGSLCSSFLRCSSTTSAFVLPLTSSDPKQPIASVGIGSVSNNTCAMVTTWYMGYSHPLQNGSPYIHSNNYNRYIRGLIDHHPPILAARHFLKQGRPGIVGDMYKNHSGASFPKSTTDLGFWRSLRFGYTGHDQLVGYNPPHPTMSHYVPVLSQ